MLMPSRILLALCGGLAMSTTALAQANNAVEDFFKGKTIRIVVSSEPGGSYDGYSRLIARHLGKFIPGHPQLVVQNMPGAGGLVATNWLYNVAQKDGTVLGQIQRQIPLMQILGEQGTQFETAKFNWIGSMASEATICVSRKDSPVKTAEDLLTKEMIVAGSGPNSSENIPTVLNNVLGTKFKVISGYPSQTAGTLSVERGETTGVCTTYSSLLVRNKHWFEGPDKFNILMQAGLRRHSDLPNVPLAMELASKPEDKALFELFDTPLQIGRPYVMPPGVPAERVKAIRTAFNQMVKDKDFITENEKEGRELEYIDGDAMQDLYERLGKTPKAMIDRLKEALKPKGPVTMAKVEAPKAVEGAIAELEENGAKITLKLSDGKMYKAALSGSRTDLQIAGKKGERKDLKLGQVCAVTAPAEGQEASAVACK
jgi:tripartite-type tricarboxylate transporter receptor subunit TctC